MTTRQVLIVGGIVGLLVSTVVLALIWFGVGGVLNVGGTHLMYAFWPSSVMLVVGWRSTIPGVMSHSIVSRDQLRAVHGGCICTAPSCAVPAQTSPQQSMSEIEILQQQSRNCRLPCEEGM
jgi:hypothetical protein